MNIGFIAHNSKKTLMENFCLAYKYILSKHHLYATGITGRRIEEVTNLKVYKFLPGSVGGDKQFMDMIERNCMDMVIFFYNPLETSPNTADILSISRCCDQYNIPIATNIATRSWICTLRWRVAVCCTVWKRRYSRITGC